MPANPKLGSQGKPSPESGAEFLLDGSPITLDRLDSALGHRIHARMADNVWNRIERSAAQVRAIAASDVAAYGINTGFGSLCTTRISPSQVEALQTNLILSHAVGVGDPVPSEIVRWMMLLKVHALTHGVSGASRRTIEALLTLLNNDVLPIVPSQGSLGASGDLAPLAHMVLPMLGHGDVLREGSRLPAREALVQIGLEKVQLAAKDGLALINGTQFMAAHAAYILVNAKRLLKHADIIATMSLEALMGSIKPFDERLHQLRPHRGAIETADNVRRLMRGSQILPSHANCGRVQDPYSLRCIPQVHGASRDAIAHAAAIVETEMNSVTDNPVIFENGDVVSGGLFHGQPLALALDYAAIALAEIASISERRIYLLLTGVAGLPLLLMRDTGINSGFMLPHYTAAALVSENKGLCMPASVDSIPTSLGQEDHVSMGARAATKCLQVLTNCQTVLAIEQLCAAQALDYRAPLRPGAGPAAALEVVRQSISHAEKDRLFGDDIAASLRLLRANTVLLTAEAAAGGLS